MKCIKCGETKQKLQQYRDYLKELDGAGDVHWVWLNLDESFANLFDLPFDENQWKKLAENGYQEKNWREKKFKEEKDHVCGD